MKRREFIAAGAGAAAVAMTAGMVSGCSTTGAAGECRKGCAKVNNKDFYVGGAFDANGISSGKFDVAKGKQAYFDLMRKFGYPVFRSFTDEAFMLRETKQTDKTQYLGFWATDFAKGDFAKFGMGGVIGQAVCDFFFGLFGVKHALPDRLHRSVIIRIHSNSSFYSY